MANVTDVGVNAVVNGFESFILKLEAMSKAQLGMGKAGVAGSKGVALLSSALSVAATAGLAAATAIVAATGLIIKGFIDLSSTGIQTARDFETAFAGVLKTTNGLGTNLFDLTDTGEIIFQQFRELAREIPLTFEELARIGEFVGQLGVVEDEIIGVTEVIAALGVSTNLSISDASLLLSKFQGLMSDTGEITEESISRSASALVFLGNNYKALESEILLVGRNIAQATSLFGISEADTLAIATSVIEAGLSAEAGGSAVSNALAAIQIAVSSGGETLETFSNALGLSAKDFVSLWETDATEAFTLFVENLTESGADAILTLQDLNLDQRRSIRTFLGMSKESISLRKTIEDSNIAWEANTALIREAEIRYNTIDSQIQTFKNNLRDTAFDIGQAFQPLIETVLPIAQEIADGLKESVGPAFQEIVDVMMMDGGLLDALLGLGEALGLPTNAEETVEFVERLTQAATEKIGDFTAFVENFTQFAEVAAFLFQQGPDKSFLENLGVEEGTVSVLTDVGEALGFIAGVLLNIIETLAIIPAQGFANLAGQAVAGFGAITDRPELVNLGEQMIENAGLDDVPRVFSEIWADTTGQISGIIATQPIPVSPEVIQAGVTGIAENTSFGYQQALLTQQPLMQEATQTTFQNQLMEATPAIESVFSETMTQEAAFLLQEYESNMDANQPAFTEKSEQTGFSVATGIAAGITAGTPEIERAAIRAVESAINAANAALDARSPAKNAMPIGVNFTEGMASGVVQATQSLMNTVRASTASMLGAASQTIASTIDNSNSIDRSISFGDVNVTAKPEAPQRISQSMMMLTQLGS
jgi:TP901 family phage tail tape measure protein